MKLSFPIKISRKGISFIYKGEVSFFRWAWKSKIEKIEDRPTISIIVPTKKLTGLDYSEILFQWAYLVYPDDHIIVLHNINVEAKNVGFWAKIPLEQVKHFIKDVVILRCKDISEMTRLVNNIGIDFAEAYGFSKGLLIITNKEEYIEEK